MEFCRAAASRRFSEQVSNLICAAADYNNYGTCFTLDAHNRDPRDLVVSCAWIYCGNDTLTEEYAMTSAWVFMQTLARPGHFFRFDLG